MTKSDDYLQMVVNTLRYSFMFPVPSYEKTADFIKLFGDYCVERTREDHRQMIHAVEDRAVKEAMDNHLKECHPQTKKVDAAWFANTRCFIHNVGIKAIKDDEILEFQCGCRFQRKRGI